MGSFSIWHWLILALVVAVLFRYRNRISRLIDDLAGAIRAFKGRPASDERRPATGKRSRFRAGSWFLVLAVSLTIIAGIFWAYETGHPLP
jgi:sec-independent protein translocase protein TatA